jgi:hypothetical protein
MAEINTRSIFEDKPLDVNASLAGTTEGMLVYDPTGGDPTPMFEVLVQRGIRFMTLECEGYPIPTFETQTSQHVGEVSLGRFFENRTAA